VTNERGKVREEEKRRESVTKSEEERSERGKEKVRGKEKWDERARKRGRSSKRRVIESETEESRPAGLRRHKRVLKLSCFLLLSGH